jgi:hypothetical protein
MFFLEKKKNNIIKVEKINRNPIGIINSFSTYSKNQEPRINNNNFSKERNNNIIKYVFLRKEEK